MKVIEMFNRLKYLLQAKLNARKSARLEGSETATPGGEDHPPTPSSSTAKFRDDEPNVARPTQPPHAKTWVQDPDDGQGSSTAQNRDYHQQERDTEGVVLGSPQHLAAPPGRESTVRNAMFTNAHINNIRGGTFNNVAHIHEYSSPPQGGGPGFPIAMLGLQAVSFATRSHYPHCNHPFNAPAPLIPEPTSTSSPAIYLPMFRQETPAIFGPFVLWLLIKTVVRRWSIEHL